MMKQLKINNHSELLESFDIYLKILKDSIINSGKLHVLKCNYERKPVKFMTELKMYYSNVGIMNLFATLDPWNTTLN